MNSGNTQADSISKLAGKGVLITRPKNLCAYLVSEIKKRAAYPVVFPTIEIVSTAKSSGIEQFLHYRHHLETIVLFVSRNAVHAVEELMRSHDILWPGHLTCAAVGPKTAQEIRFAFGVSEVVEPVSSFGIEGLLNTSRFENLNGVQMAVIDGGGENSTVLCEALIKRGSPKVDHFMVYHRQLPQSDTAEAAKWIENEAVHYVIVSSVAGASNMMTLLGDRLIEQLKRACVIAYSARIGRFLHECGFSSIAVAAEPVDDAVIQAMEHFSV